MKKRWTLILFVALMLCVVVLLGVQARQTKAANLLSVYASPINAGCYITLLSQISVEWEERG